MNESPNIWDEGKTLLFDKPYRWTSFDVVRKVRRVTKARRVGHAGTLDPLATGLLIVCTGRNTKKISEIQDLEKEYTGTMVLGATTPSYDRETAIENNVEVIGLTEELINSQLELFKGEIKQVPPLHSAKKIEGKRAYKIARKGVTAELKPSTVTIKEFKITDFSIPELKFRVVCSKGTYIRSLVHDLGQSLGFGAYLHSLKRTRIGPYLLDDANNIFEFVNKFQADIQ